MARLDNFVTTLGLHNDTFVCAHVTLKKKRKKGLEFLESLQLQTRRSCTSKNVSYPYPCSGLEPHPEEEVQRVLDGSEREGVLSARQIDGQVIELLPLGHHLPTAAAHTGRSILTG